MRSIVLLTFAFGAVVAAGCGDDKKSECTKPEGASLALAEGDDKKKCPDAAKATADKKDDAKNPAKTDPSKTAEEKEPDEAPLFKATLVAANLGKVDKPGDSVLFLAGGYASCPLDTAGMESEKRSPTESQIAQTLFEKSKTALNEATGENPAFFVTCFSPNPLDHVSGEKPLHWIASDGTSGSGSIDRGVEAWDAFLKKLENPFIYAVGHSYGGAMAIAATTRFASVGSVAKVTTFDPISFYGCTPSILVAAYIFGHKTPLIGCRSFPGEPAFDVKTRLEKPFTELTNYYQKGFPYLASSERTGWTNREVTDKSAEFAALQLHEKVKDHNKFQAAPSAASIPKDPKEAAFWNWDTAWIAELKDKAVKVKAGWTTP